MGLFSKPKVPSIDVGALQRIAQQNADKQRGIVTGLKSGLAPSLNQFQTDRTALSARILPEQEGALEKYSQDLSGVDARQADANQVAGAAFREKQFRQVPELQRAIRESLGGSGLTANASARGAVANPLIDAARTSRDFDANLETTRLNDNASRSEGLATTGFNTRTNALATRLGLDDDTIKYLTDTGRGDLIREAEGLLGTEEQLGANMLGIEQARQQNEMAKASAKNSFRSNIIGGLTQLGGAAIGFGLGGPMGAGLGAQLGGTAGQLATGSPTSFDPTLLYAMAARNPAATRRTAVVDSLGGQIPVRPY